MDDTNFAVYGGSATEVENLLKKELENIQKWLLVNRLTVNVEKTKYMIIGSRQKLSKIPNDQDMKVLNGSEEIKRVKTTKSLGVVIDQNLCCKQVDSISTKVSKAIGTLRRPKSYISYDLLQLIYKAIVSPYFDYCFLVWGNCNQTLREKIQYLQNQAARVITGDSYEVRSKDILRKLV